MWRWAHSDEVQTEIFTFWSSLPATTERPEHQHPTHFSCNVGRQRHQFFCYLESTGTLSPADSPSDILASYFKSSAMCQQDGSYKVKFP